MSLENQKKKSATESEPLPIQRVPETEFCVNPDKDKVIEKLCEKFKEAWKNATVEPSLKMM